MNNSSNNIRNDQDKSLNENKNFDNKLKMYVDNFNIKQYNKYISLFQLMHSKPYILDPLIYDSKKILDKFIPINGRFTAKALCKLFAFVNNQFFFPSYIINKIRKKYTIDKSIEALILTGAMSRTWGMGFQLFECEYNADINDEFNLYKKKNKKKYKTKNVSSKKKKNNNKKKKIVGYGQSDFSGCLALSFPEIDLSITILLSDIFKGADVCHLLLEYILKLYGLKPQWKVPIEMSELVKAF
ncbi:atypical protein kinase, ABC-1 family,putative [Plasmodium sp. gorilla clade G2]|nr:atypical protein kinase, ABC-1 family,putative [Plasmodium sp. gorilla clade G2]SOV20334.1 atypical protein kinase, ABC-1 family,putative [Plasmodium sp. gorilla clade G2]